MATEVHDKSADSVAGKVFATTHWSVVLAAKQLEGPSAEAALERLCRIYWPPLYAFIRRQGYAAEAAQDLTQEFLSRLIHKEWLNHLQDQRGKFRSFLLTFLKHFLSDQRDLAHAQKRGGGQALISLDQMAEEERAWVEPVDHLTPEEVFERRWAQALMARSLARLGGEYADRGKSEMYELLKDIQPGEHGAQSYTEIGVRFGMSEQAVKNAVHRLRRRHREILHEEIAQTVTLPSEIEEEVQNLMAVLAR
jgi:RNA polymerase sigma-70 factor (ECF subfamily)